MPRSGVDFAPFRCNTFRHACFPFLEHPSSILRPSEAMKTDSLLLILVLLCSSLKASESLLTPQNAIQATNAPAQGLPIKPLHEADLQRLFPEAKHRQIGPLAEIASQISQKWDATKKSLSSYKTLTKILPILEWLPPYIKTGWKRSLYKDLSAGIVVGIMLVPQAIAYSLVASLPAQYG